MKKISLILLIAAVLASCSGEKFSEKPVSDFNLKPNSLKNHAIVTINAWSGGPAAAKKNVGYQYLLTDTETGEIYRMISKDLYGSDFFDSNTTYEFVSYSSQDPDDFLLFLAMNEFSGGSGGGIMRQEIMKKGNGETSNIKKPHINLPQYVYSNSEFPQIEETDYPAVFGMVVQVRED